MSTADNVPLNKTIRWFFWLERRNLSAGVDPTDLLALSAAAHLEAHLTLAMRWGGVFYTGYSNNRNNTTAHRATFQARAVQRHTVLRLFAHDITNCSQG